MSESALKSHSRNVKHKQNSRCEQRVTLSSFGFGLRVGTSTCSSRNKKACVKVGTSKCSTKRHLNWGVDYMYMKIERKTGPWKNVICPWKVLEKKGLRSNKKNKHGVVCRAFLNGILLLYSGYLYGKTPYQLERKDTYMGLKSGRNKHQEDSSDDEKE